MEWHTRSHKHRFFEFWTVYTKMYFESILQNNRFWTNYLADRCDFLKNFTTALVIRLSSEDSCSHRICRQTGGLPSLQWQEGAISAQKRSSTFSENQRWLLSTRGRRSATIVVTSPCLSSQMLGKWKYQDRPVVCMFDWAWAWAWAFRKHMV